MHSNFSDNEIHHNIISNKNKFSFSETFSALKYRNYRLWFWGQMISLFGSWMQSTALAFLVFELTHSPAYLGYVGFAAGIPAWLFTFYSGVIADRYSRKKIIIITQFWMMFLAFLLSALTFTNIIEPEMIITISFLLGIGNSFEATARHAFVNELVEKEDLTNAIALNSTMFNTATALSPAIAGIIYAFLGPAWCFTINGISFIAVIFNLFKMDIKKRNIINEKKSVLNELKEGIIYLTKNKLLLKIISITSILSFFGMGLVTLFPAWAVKILNGNSTTNGFLQSARGFGAVSFAIIIASINKYIIRGKYLAASTIILPTLIFLFSFTNNLYESLFMLVLIGGVIILMYNLSNGLIQTNVEENYRGRILSFYTFSFFALYPLGALWIGMLAEHFGIRTSIIINSAILFLFGIIIWFKSDKLKYTS
ncbi:MAG: MFS transporter [Melioribacteraceae bacterium]|nr:MFS transporter [Melioribacteraceae bacterium]